MSRLGEICSKLLITVGYRNGEKARDINFRALKGEDIEWLIHRIERLEKFTNHFKGAERIELAIWRAGDLSIMNFDPRPLLAEE